MSGGFENRQSLWCLTGNTGAIGNGSHQWFSALTSGVTNGRPGAKNGALINDGTNVPANAWFTIDVDDMDTLLIGYACRVVSLTAGDRTVTTTEVRAVAVGMAHFDASDLKFSKAAVTRATQTNANTQRASSGLVFLNCDARAAAPANGLVQSPDLGSSMVPVHGFLRDSGAVPATDDFTDWFVQCGKRQTGFGGSLAVSTLTPVVELNVRGLAVVHFAAKFIPTFAGGTTDDNINIDAELYAKVAGSRTYR